MTRKALNPQERKEIQDGVQLGRAILKAETTVKFQLPNFDSESCHYWPVESCPFLAAIFMPWPATRFGQSPLNVRIQDRIMRKV